MLYIWDVETDQVQAFDFKSGEGQEGLDDNVAEAQQQLTLDVRGLILLYFHFCIVSKLAI